jgi:hypothetical protein
VSSSPVFEWLCTELCNRTGLASLAGRGTLRLALQKAGLEPRTLTKEQGVVLVERVLAGELKLLGIANAVPLCTDIGLSLRLMAFAKNAPESAEAAFARLGRK